MGLRLSWPRGQRSWESIQVKAGGAVHGKEVTQEISVKGKVQSTHPSLPLKHNMAIASFLPSKSCKIFLLWLILMESYRRRKFWDTVLLAKLTHHKATTVHSFQVRKLTSYFALHYIMLRQLFAMLIFANHFPKGGDKDLL